MTMTPERLAELDAVYTKPLHINFSPEWVKAIGDARRDIHKAYPDLRATIDAQAAMIARQDEALNIAHTAFADCDQSNPMQVEAIAIVRAALTGAA